MTPNPAPLFIRNTFLDFGPNRPPSLEGFYEERTIRSCPVSIDGEGDPLGSALLGAARSAGSRASATTPSKDEPARVLLPATPETELFSSFRSPLLNHDLLRPRKLEGSFDGALGTSGRTADAPSALDDDEGGDADLEDDNEMSNPTGSVQVLRLADAINQPKIGSPDLPTQGSVGHRVGVCKPCAFLEKGCTSGVDCRFCHLCGPDEKKRRKKEKLALKRQVSRWQRTMTPASSASPATASPLSCLTGPNAWEYGFFS